MSAAVYLIEVPENHELCSFVQVPGSPRAQHSFIGKSVSSSWTPLPVNLVQKGKNGRKYAHSDAPWSGRHVLSLRSRVVELIGDTLSQFGELLPLDCASAALYAYNITRVLDVLDESNSTVKRFSDGFVMMIDNFAFLELPSPMGIFKIPNTVFSPIFVGREFVELWTGHGFAGLTFKKVWPRE